MIVLAHVWDFISGNATGPRVAAGTRRELCNLRAAVDSCTTVLDASNWGGAVGISHSLTQAGMDFVMASKVRSVEVNQRPMLVVSLFNVIGGCFRIYDTLNIESGGL